jgi:hypothetical protein
MIVGMTDVISTAATVLGILLEMLAMIGLARLFDADIPKRAMLATAGFAIAIPVLTIASVAAGLIWGIEPTMIAAAILLFLLPGTAVSAYGIWALVRWLNCRHDPGLQKLPTDAP